MADASDGSAGIRLTELLAVLSLGADLGMGHPMEHAMRQSLLAVRLGKLAGLDRSESGVVYYSSLIAWVGCHVDAYEQAKWFGDDRAFKSAARDVDLGKPLQTAAYVLRFLGAGRPPLERLRVGTAFMGGGYTVLSSMFQNHWAAAARLIERLQLGGEVRDSVAETFERWDGKGAPAGARGEELLMSSRLVNLADVAVAHYDRGGVQAAVDVARARSGSQFDPQLVDLLCSSATSLFADLEAVPAWDAALAVEQDLDRQLSEHELDDALEAIADFVDLKSPYTIGHSRGVANLAGDAALVFGLPTADVTLVRRAGLVHDLGRLGVSNGIWDKKSPLTPVELERVRLHPYLTERMLTFSSTLATLGALAAQHHERLDGSGYPRGASGSALTPAGRILAAADMYRTHTEPRPHRAARSVDDAAADLEAEVRAGRLDGDAVAAVLKATGHRVVRVRGWPAGLTTREVEVLRLLARGLSHKEIAHELVISPKTVSNHIERIYAKIDVTNRAMASVFAVQHGLTRDD